jgi:hypothetical protein
VGGAGDGESIMNTHLPDSDYPRATLSGLIFLLAILALAAILGSLKATWWQDCIAFVLVYLVRWTARREGL